MSARHLVILFTVCWFRCAIAGGTNAPHSDTHFRTPPIEKLDRVQMTGIRLISTEQDARRNFDTLELRKFVWKIPEAIDKSLGNTNETFELVIQVRLSKDKRPDFEIASKDNIPKDMLEKVSRGLGQLPDYRSRADDFLYEAQFTILKKP